MFIQDWLNLFGDTISDSDSGSSNWVKMNWKLQRMSKEMGVFYVKNVRPYIY
jgi:hypothetical protein